MLRGFFVLSGEDKHASGGEGGEAIKQTHFRKRLSATFYPSFLGLK